MTYLGYGIKTEIFSVLHVVCKHFDHLWQFKFPSPAELEQKVVSVPWIMRDVIALNPFLHLIQHFLLLSGKVVQVSIKTIISGLSLLLAPC